MTARNTMMNQICYDKVRTWTLRQCWHVLYGERLFVCSFIPLNMLV
jgi:hypothetical protein